jgi:hypothetical protein
VSRGTRGCPENISTRGRVVAGKHCSNVDSLPFRVKPNRLFTVIWVMPESIEVERRGMSEPWIVADGQRVNSFARRFSSASSDREGRGDGV